MNHKVAVLILAHKAIDYFIKLAENNQDILYFVHFDKKYLYNSFSIPPNMIVLTGNARVDVKWGGFSQVQAMINIFETALQNPDIDFFHVVSGEDVLLSSDYLISHTLMWNTDEIFMDLSSSLKHRFRVRFFAPHVETNWQRKSIGKLFTFGLKILDRVLVTKSNFWFGSNWFSIRRKELMQLMDLAKSEEVAFFKHRLNPDEHFFQYLVVIAGLKDKISPLGNNRYIIFDKNYNNGNNPIYLTTEELLNINSNRTYFFARKVDALNQRTFYNRVNSA